MAQRLKMGITSFLESRCFDTHLKTRIHICQFILIIVVIALTGVRVNTMDTPPSRSVILPIIMGVKSLVVLSYQIITTHIDRFKKWKSLKAYAILNCLEILFWFVVVIITFMGVSTRCVGTSCAMACLVSILSMVLTFIALWTAVISVKDQRHFRLYGMPRGAVVAGGRDNSHLGWPRDIYPKV